MTLFLFKYFEKRCLLWASLLLLSVGSYSQHLEANHWYFGYGAGLKFQPNGPQILNNGVQRSGGAVATISNQNGELVLYADRNNIYNSLHDTIQGGKNIWDARNLIILKKPNSKFKYLVVAILHGTGTSGRNCQFVEIDISIGGGKVTGSRLISGLFQRRGMALLDHDNGIDKWLLLKEHNSLNYRAFMVNQSGISLSPVLSQVAQDSTYSNIFIKSSPNSQYIISVYRHPKNKFELYRFDGVSGKVSNIIYSYNSASIRGEIQYAAFSPNSKMLFVPIRDTLKVFNISSNDSLLIGNSQKVIYTNPDSNSIWDLQLGLDGQLYFLNGPPNFQLSKKISRILCPDNAFNSLSIQDTILGPFAGHLGTQLPTLNQTLYVNTHKLQAQSLGDSVVCPGDSVTLTAYGAATSEFYWSPATGLSCTNCQSPKVSPSTTTTYTVRGIARSCAKDVNHSAQITIYVSPPKGQASISGDSVLCPGKTAVLSGPAGFNTYAWSNGVVGRTQTVQAGGSYQLQVSNKCYTDTLSYTLKTEPALDYRFPSDTVVCASDLPLELSGWSNLPFSINYSNQPKYEVTRPGEYIYEVRSACSSLDYFVRVDTAKQGNKVLSTTVPDTLVAGSQQRFEFNGYAVGSNKEVSAFAAEDSLQINQLEDDKNGWLEVYQIRNNGVCSDTLFIKRIEIIKPQAPDTLPQKSDCKVALAPNPGSVEFSLSTNQNIEQLAVFDARSKKLIELEGLEKGVYTFSAAKWSAGTYYISAQCVDGSLKKLRWIKVK